MQIKYKLKQGISREWTGNPTKWPNGLYASHISTAENECVVVVKDGRAWFWSSSNPTWNETRSVALNYYKRECEWIEFIETIVTQIENF